MTPWIVGPAPTQILYPDSDGKPMAENTKQLRWIFVLYGGISAVFRQVADVFVAGDLLWYPVEGEPQIRNAPDVMVVFGRPKGDRGSYRQWLENGIGPQVVFEVLSPGNTIAEMIDKFAFYEEHGVEEYYVFDPDQNRLTGYQRRGETLVRIPQVNGWVSPRLKIRFDLSGPEMVVWGPDGQRFMTYEELMSLYEKEKADLQLARQQAKDAQKQTDLARQQAEDAQKQTDLARQQAEDARKQTDLAEQRNARLAEKLRQLGIDPNAPEGS